MRGVYAVILGLYPVRHRAIFGSEMMETFEEAAKESQGRGFVPSMLFAGRELSGLLRGLVAEWMATLFSNKSYLAADCLARQESPESLGIAEMEARIQRLVRGMEYAISHHDFPKARLYSDEERKTRGRLQRLLNERT